MEVSLCSPQHSTVIKNVFGSTQNHQTSGQQMHVEDERDMILGSIAWSECSARQPWSVSVLLMGLNEGCALLAESVRIQ